MAEPQDAWAGQESAAAIAQHLLSRPGNVVELRAFGIQRRSYKVTSSGYFDNARELLVAAASLDGQAEGIYFTLNPLTPALLARAKNRMVERPKSTTGDAEIVARQFLLVDVDPSRPSGVSATEEEKTAARSTATDVGEYLTSLGFPDPIKADSGNGFHALYPIDLPPNDDGLIQKVLEALAFRFDTDRAAIDRSVHNPARLCRLYGTVARKGDSTPDRPHRRSKILSVPDHLRPVPIESLRSAAAKAPRGLKAKSRKDSVDGLDVDQYLQRHGLDIDRRGPWQGGRRWVLSECPFDPEHRDGAAYIVQLPSGGIAAGCHHNGCSGRGWHELRDRVEPGWRGKERSAAKSTTTTTPRALQRYLPFPTHLLPGPFRAFVEQASASVGCDPAYAAVPLLVAAASAVGNSRRIRLKRGWVEPPILWAALVGDSGSLKSPGLDLGVRPVQELQKAAFDRHEGALDRYEQSLTKYEAKLSSWKKEGGKGEPPEKPEEPISDRYYVSDTTVEALAPLLSENPRGLLVCCDELAGWFRSFNQYKQAQGGDTAHWLEMHGARPMVVDRKSGKPKTIYVPSAAACVVGGIQPGPLRRTLSQEHFENGLAARLLLVYPPRRPRKWTETEVDVGVEKAVERVFSQLYGLRPFRGTDGKPTPQVVDLTPRGKEAWIKFYNEHGSEQLDLHGAQAAAWSKLEGYTARFALLFHLIREVGGEPAVGVDERDIEAAVQLVRWFGGETKRIYTILSGSEEEERLRNWVEIVERLGSRVSRRRWQRSRSLATSEEAEAQLNELVEAGYGKWEQAPVGPKGGHPKREFVLASDTTPTDIPANGVVSVSEPPSSSQQAGAGTEDHDAIPFSGAGTVSLGPSRPQGSDTDRTYLPLWQRGVVSDEDDWGEV